MRRGWLGSGTRETEDADAVRPPVVRRAAGRTGTMARAVASIRMAIPPRRQQVPSGPAVPASGTKPRSASRCGGVNASRARWRARSASGSLLCCDQLHEGPARADWSAWFEAFLPGGALPAAGQDFPNLDMAVKAAAMGAGVVIADLVLCREELRTGALVLPVPDLICDPPGGRVCLIGHRDAWDGPDVAAFRDWTAPTAGESSRGL